MKLLKLAIAVAFVGLLFVGGGGTFLLMMTALGESSDQAPVSGSNSCVVTINAPTSARLDRDQLDNAQTIVRVGVSRGIPERGLVIAIATALQESHLRNLNYGDRDSVGLFQQRPSSGWGTVVELTDPPTSAGKFYAALLEVPRWRSMSVTDAAQAVQRSAFPYAYAKWESLATTLVGQMTSGRATTTSQSITVNSIECSQTVGEPIASNTVGGMLQVALAQRGEPYVWGATGPDAFDCSGLVVYAWRKAGHPLRVRTSEQMYQVSDRVASGEERPGDLLFTHFAAAGPGHVMIVVKPGLAVQAPRTGDVVKLVPYDPDKWVIGRLEAEAFRNGTIPSEPTHPEQTEPPRTDGSIPGTPTHPEQTEPPRADDPLPSGSTQPEQTEPPRADDPLPSSPTHPEQTEPPRADDPLPGSPTHPEQT